MDILKSELQFEYGDIAQKYGDGPDDDMYSWRSCLTAQAPFECEYTDGDTSHQVVAAAYGRTSKEAVWNARILAARWNACQGIPTEELEAGSIRALGAIYHALGWQGGTIHQVVRRIESLVKLEREVAASTLAKLEGRQ